MLPPFRFRSYSSLMLALLLTPLGARSGTVEPTVYNGVPAYRLTDGKTEAVVVPSLSGRIMSFGAVGGANWMWNASPEKLKGKEFKNHGGDKTFAGPHPLWATFGNVWPPDPTWDGVAHTAEVLTDGRLKTTGNVWRGFGVRVLREYSFNAAGEFVTVHTLEKVEGEPRQLSIWPVTQAVPPDAVFIPLNENSAYTPGYHAYDKLPANARVETIPGTPLDNGQPHARPKLLKLTPTTGGGYKIGADSPVAAIAAVKGNTAYLQRTEILIGQYPDGAEGAGFTIEYYNHWDAGAAHYMELELLSPLYIFKAGDAKSFTTRWSLHTLPDAPQEQLKAIEILLNEKPKPDSAAAK